MSKAKATRVEKQRRILIVQGWIIDGAQDNYILRQIQTQWGIKIRQARNYLKVAYGNWRRDTEINMEDRRAAKVAKLQNDIRGLKEEYRGTPAGINAITRVEKLIIKLEDLEPPKKLQMDATVTTTEMTREERDEYIKKMAEKAAKYANS